MRTLKKSLALVLALVMVLGLGVVGASADNKLDSYTDAGEIGDAYVEAVGVLTGLGIVDGRTDTEIVPEATYNRAEAAKIIAYMLLGKDQADALKATVAPFEDVSVDFWAAGYIAYCAELGIISGMTETTFEPYGTLTGYQWAKMLLVAVGYGKNGEFEGDSWSLNTATVVAKTGLNEGDLEAADHVALRREQAMLFAFNALNLKQVTYSPNSTNYVYDIWGYVFADGTGTTLGEEVYDLATVEGQIIDNEAMGNANTVVDPTNKWAKNVEIDANTGLDLMWHAVRVWYVDGKTNTNVYVTDLAETTVYECMNITAGDKEATKQKAEDHTIGNSKLANAVEYETYLINNKALDLGYDYVTVIASFGSYGYAGKNYTMVGATKVDNDYILTDVSEVSYGDGIVFVNAGEKAWHVWATTTTSGVIKDIKQSSNDVVSVTLADGTTLEMSNFWLLDEVEHPSEYDEVPETVIGRNYNFVLDTHGDVIYATRDYARDVYVYTGDAKWDGGHNDWNVDWVYNCRFLNVTTGEELVVPVVMADGKNFATRADRGDYFDITASTTADGLYVASPIDARTNPYTEQYVIGNFTMKSSLDQYWVAQGDVNVYFDPDTILFLVANGRGSAMEVEKITGIEALKEYYGVASNGMVDLDNAIFTVTDTLTGNAKYASVCFFLYENVGTMSNYVFVPADVSINKWTSATGDALNMYYTYGGAYLEGEPFEITVTKAQVKDWANGTTNILPRGFYTYTTDYVNGKKVNLLTEKIDNARGELCFYLDVDFIAHNPTGDADWTFTSGLYRFTADNTTKIIDTTDEDAELSLYTLWQYYDSKIGEDVELAFTVNPNTHKVDYVYVVKAGWDAKVTLTLDKELVDAGWTIGKITGDGIKDIDLSGKGLTSYDLNDSVAENGVLGNNVINVTLVNAGLKGYDTEYTTYMVSVNGKDCSDQTNITLDDGTITFKTSLSEKTAIGTKSYKLEIGGLSLGTVTVAETEDSGRKIANANEGVFKTVTLGDKLTVDLATENDDAFVVETDGCDKATHYHWDADVTYGNYSADVTGELIRNSHIVEFSFYPLHADVTYTVANAAWVHNANVVD